MEFIGALILSLTLIFTVLWRTKYKNNVFAFLSLSLIILSLVFLASVGSYEMLFSDQDSDKKYANQDLSTFLSMLFGTSVAFAGAWVAIVIASRIESLESTRFIQGHITPIYELIGKLEYSFMKIGWKITPEKSSWGEYPLSKTKEVSDEFNDVFMEYKYRLINFYETLKNAENQHYNISQIVAVLDQNIEKKNINLQDTVGAVVNSEHFEDEGRFLFVYSATDEREDLTIEQCIDDLKKKQAELDKLDMDNLASDILGKENVEIFDRCLNETNTYDFGVNQLNRDQMKNILLMMSFDVRTISDCIEKESKFSLFSESFNPVFALDAKYRKNDKVLLEYDGFEFSGESFGDAVSQVIQYVNDKNAFKEKLFETDFKDSIGKLLDEFSATLKEALNNKLATDFLLKKLGEEWGLGKLYSWQILIENHDQAYSEISRESLDELFRLVYSNCDEEHEKFHSLASGLFSEISKGYELNNLFNLFRIESEQLVMKELIDYALEDKKELQKVVS